MMVVSTTEKCLVVRRDVVAEHGVIAEKGVDRFTHLTSDSWAKLSSVLREKRVYKERRGNDNVEQDPTYKQIIPYAFFLLRNGRFLLYQRSTDPKQYSEERLHGKVSLGVGGHIRPGETV